MSLKNKFFSVFYVIKSFFIAIFTFLLIPFKKCSYLLIFFIKRILKFLINKFSANAKLLRKFEVQAKQIISLEEEYKLLSDASLKAKTNMFREKLDAGSSLDDILVEAFAVVKEASRRTLGLVHFKEQLLGGIALHKGMMTEMKTGEGKTLVATLSAYLNALTGKGVHIVTVNDYLAKRDAEEMGQIYKFLGLTVGCSTESLTDEQKKNAYSCDITYVTGNQLGFDYLRDNMKYDIEQVCMRGLNYAIIDEADCVLIDEARTPLIISGDSQKIIGSYNLVTDLVAKLGIDDYEKDEKQHSVVLTDSGVENIEMLLIKAKILKPDHSLYTVENVELVHEINQSLKAHMLFKKDVNYIVKNGQILLIDEFTGRILEGRRYSDGLHQAIEAKEKVKIQMENFTMASITFQKFFALYNKIAGMSGTCVAESEELEEIYKAKAIAIPTHMPMIRNDLDDVVYRTFEEKFDAIVEEVQIAHKKQQPILLITGSVEMSEIFSSRFKILGLKHQVLNARLHKEEAEVIADAGVPGAITIATNMAGRGTDIQLGGNLRIRLKRLKNQGLSDIEVLAKKPEIEKEIAAAKEIVIQAGGLYVLGTERNESRRVDDQARGRSGRQGDVGQSRFFLSLQDDLIRVFGSSSKLDQWLLRFGMKYGEAITHPFITKAIAKAQGAVEARNFDWRKNVFKYDQVLDEQRKMIYRYRNRFLSDENLREQMEMFIDFELNQILDRSFLNKNIEIKEAQQLNSSELQKEFLRIFAVNFDFTKYNNKAEAYSDVSNNINTKFKTLYKINSKNLKMIMLKSIDDLWQNHLHILDCLRQNVNLRAYAQKDPLNEYKKEGFILFENLLEQFRSNLIMFWFHMDPLSVVFDTSKRKK